MTIFIIAKVQKTLRLKAFYVPKNYSRENALVQPTF